MSPRIRVASVGDGACSLLVAGLGEPGLIIDCGSSRQPLGMRSEASGPDAAADGLLRLVEARWLGETSVVVTHLHQDHYNGLLALADRFGHGLFSTIRLYQPRLPDKVGGDFMARFVALDMFLGSRTGLPDLDFALALKRLARGGLYRHAVAEGDQITASGLVLDVLWPPRELSPGVSRRVEEAVKTFDDLARNNKRLQRALDASRASFTVSEWPRAKGLVDDFEDQPDYLEPRPTRIDDNEDEGDQPSIHGANSVEIDSSWPDGFARDLAKAARLFREAANYMSLVLATPERTFVAWGDANRSVVRKLSPRVALKSVAPHLQIALAPHHGSHGPTPNADVCVSQIGSGLAPYRLAKHGACEASVCVSTFEEGDLIFDNFWRSWWTPSLR